MSTALTQLARAHGIILDYYDIWGQPHRAPDSVLVAILGTMGVVADSDAAVADALRDVARARSEEVLPAAIVVRDDERPWRMRLTLPQSLDAALLDRSIVAEDGTTHRAQLRVHDLVVEEQTTVAGECFIARSLEVNVELPKGYHRIRIQTGDRVLADSLLAVVPRRSYWPQALQGTGRIWGITAQLYAVRSERNWGIGDFTDLRSLVEDWGARGAGIVGLNPLHALYPHNPAHASPYSPSSRLFRNWIYLDVSACAEYTECESARRLVTSAAFQSRLAALRATELVDYPGVADAKREVVERLYAHFRDHHLAPSSPRAADFRRFQSQSGEALYRHALFEALQEHFARESPHVWGWPLWPHAYRDPASPEVARFAAQHLDRIEFFQYLQWQCDLQYAAAAQRAMELGLGVGVYEDLAVSVDRGGAETWANQAVYAHGAGAGAPPDDFNLQGQDWGLPPMIPSRLRAQQYAPFIATLRANMRASGALRIDHVMGLMRLFWVPPEHRATDGVYVSYPFADLLGLLCLESERNRCLVIGEDLGTVPDEVRHALWEARVLSYRLLYFERRHDGEFKAPQEYPDQAIVAATTHDLPTLAGWWNERDIALRTELALFPNAAMREAHRAARKVDRPRLLAALQREGRLPDEIGTDWAAVTTMTAPIVIAVHAYLAASPAKVMVAQLEDVILAGEQANLPGTITEHPNWRRKLACTLEDLRTDARIRQLAEALSHARAH